MVEYLVTERKVDPMKIYDISMTISESMPVYKGKPSLKPVIETERDFSTSSAHESKLHMNLHSGTHLDMPLHMIPGGKTLETLSLDKVITPCKVFDFTNKDISIGVEDLKKKDIQEDDFILLKSKNSFEDILEGNFIYLDREGSAYLRDKKIKGVGTDSLGIERDQPDHMTHIQLLEAGIIILEGLRLKDIPEGEYTLFAAPIKIHGTEAAPVRAVLIK